MVSKLLVYFRDITLKLLPQQYSKFICPSWMTIAWDKYDWKNMCVNARFICTDKTIMSQNKKTEEDLDKFIENLGDYVIKYNVVNRRISKGGFYNRRVSYMDHPHNKEVKEVIQGEKEKEHGYLNKDEVTQINQDIINDAKFNPLLKKYRDKRFKPKYNERNKGFEVFTAILEEVDIH
jgi:hypothetical protein